MYMSREHEYARARPSVLPVRPLQLASSRDTRVTARRKRHAPPWTWVSLLFSSLSPPRRRCRLPRRGVSAVDRFRRLTPLRFSSTSRRETSFLKSRFISSNVDAILVADGDRRLANSNTSVTRLFVDSVQATRCRALSFQTLVPTERYSPDWVSAIQRFPSNTRSLHRTAVYESRGSETVRQRRARHSPLYFCVRISRYSRAVIELDRAALFAYRHTYHVPRILFLVLHKSQQIVIESCNRALACRSLFVQKEIAKGDRFARKTRRFRKRREVRCARREPFVQWQRWISSPRWSPLAMIRSLELSFPTCNVRNDK